MQEALHRALNTHPSLCSLARAGGSVPWALISGVGAQPSCWNRRCTEGRRGHTCTSLSLKSTKHGVGLPGFQKPWTKDFPILCFFID